MQLLKFHMIGIETNILIRYLTEDDISTKPSKLYNKNIPVKKI